MKPESQSGSRRGPSKPSVNRMDASSSRAGGDRTGNLGASHPSSGGRRRSSSTQAPANRRAPAASPAARERAPKTRLADDPGAIRRAQKKAEARKRSVVVWLAFLVVTSGFVMGANSQYQDLKKQAELINSKKLTLAALQKQANLDHEELDALNSPEGHERQLIRYGYLKPGSRILLIPSDPAVPDAEMPVAKPSVPAAPPGFLSRLHHVWRILSGSAAS